MLNATAVTPTRLQRCHRMQRPFSSAPPTSHHYRASHRTQTVKALDPAQPNTAELAAYAGLGLGALSFLATFIVIPRFKEQFKEPISWAEVYAELEKRKVQSISAKEAYAKAKKGAILLDVRLAEKHAASAPANSVNVPLYRPIQGWDIASTLRRVGFAFFGIYGTEYNPEFSSLLSSALPNRSKEVVVMCEMGGSMQKKEGADRGFQSRSLKAVYALQQAGYTKVTHMLGGYGDWVRSDLPVLEGGELVDYGNGEDDSPADAGEKVSLGASLGKLFSRQ